MSLTKYIELDSTFRNRNRWKDPAQFEINISQSGNHNSEDSLDPVAKSAHIERWQSNTFNLDPTTPYEVKGEVTSIVSPGLGASGDNNIIIQITAKPNHIYQQQSNYYLNAVAYDATAPSLSAARVLNYVYLGTTTGGAGRIQITLGSANHSIKSGDEIAIRDATDVTNTSAPYFFVPNGSSGANSYCTYILYNETLTIANGTPQYRNVSGYDNRTNLVTVDTTGVTTSRSGPVTDWSATHVYAIRKDPPIVGQVNNNTSSTLSFSLPVLFPDTQGVYKNSFIRMLTGAAADDTRRIHRYETFSGAAVSGTTTTVVFSQFASNVPNTYTNCYIQITSGPSTGDVRQVTSYTVTGTPPDLVRTITVNAPFTAAISPGDAFRFRTGFVDPAFSAGIAATNIFELLQYSYDNYNPLLFNGSQLSHQSAGCYEIELLNLILPNNVLDTYSGKRITFYPYVYVELSNRSSGMSAANNLIYSNNPHSNRMTFRVPVDDVGRVEQTSYIKIDGDGMVHSMKFKPNDTLFFSVHLPDGSLFKTTQIETAGPLPPNQEMQISALFSIRKVIG